ncbi:MAG: metallophosphoesterase [Desulfobulbaceae bacterium]|nr:metallophosphoesterase [Desulfobulbaceae bacterium]
MKDIKLHHVDGSESDCRIFAIGDIHGCYDKLRQLISQLPYRPGRDTLIFMGDYINRGTQSNLVIELIIRLQAEGKVYTILGNHEQLLLEYHRRGDASLLPYLRQMGIENTLESYGASDLRNLRQLTFMPESHRAFFHNLVPYHETKEYIFVHAGLVNNLSLSEHTHTQFCEGRDFNLFDNNSREKTIIFGHTPFTTPLVTPYIIGIDTGAAYGNLLTAVELPARRFYHA